MSGHSCLQFPLFLFLLLLRLFLFCLFLPLFLFLFCLFLLLFPSKLIYSEPAFEIRKGKPVPSNESQLVPVWESSDVRSDHSDSHRLQAHTDYERWRQLEEAGEWEVSYNIACRTKNEPSKCEAP